MLSAYCSGKWDSVFNFFCGIRVFVVYSYVIIRVGIFLGSLIPEISGFADL